MVVNYKVGETEVKTFEEELYHIPMRKAWSVIFPRWKVHY
jgi:hypothetical protein